MTCLRCGYDLSHTAIDAACPECGLAAERSLNPSLHPDDAPPRWVHSIAWATLMLLLAYLILILLPFAWALNYYGSVYQFYLSPLDALENTALGAINNNAFPAVAMLTIGGMALAALLHWIANLLLSRDERPRELSRWRWLHRWAMRLLPLGPLAAMGLAMAVTLQLWWTTAAYSVATISLIAHSAQATQYLFALAIVCPTLTFLRLRWLAKRLNRPRLAEHIGIVAGGSGLALLAVIVLALPAMELVRHAGAAFILLVVLPWATLGMFSLWSVLLLFVICPLFFRSASHAKRKWITADAARPTLIAPPQPAPGRTASPAPATFTGSARH